MALTTKLLSEMIEGFAPRRYQEAWDNTGLNVDLHPDSITGILVALDVTPQVISEAAERGCNMIVSHHPLLFSAIKTVDSGEYTGRCLAMLMREGISLYCAHTSMDSAAAGINHYLADSLGLESIRPLEAHTASVYYKVAVSVPPQYKDTVRSAMADAGAGALGDYTHCTYSVEGEGTFLPQSGSHPAIGQVGELEHVRETWIQSLCAAGALPGVLAAVRAVHPYEQPAIDVFELKNVDYDGGAGLGAIGDLPDPLPAKEVLDALKQILETDSLRFAGDPSARIKTIALCGGGGSDLIPAAVSMGAQLYITGELKHHNYLDPGIALVEAGHFDTEKCFCKLMAGCLQNALGALKYNLVSVNVSRHVTRPYINY